ncbi:MAG: hypothetical protein E6Q97_29305 [Desulfurellales bacterium]|nr:MAG: hypothetical protein E6Q97_29305 [Desulfurellales bacterium]
MAKYDDYGHGDSDGNYNEREARDQLTNHGDLRTFEHGYSGSSMGDMRSQEYQDSLRDAFRNAGFHDRDASALSADLSNAEYLDRAKRYGIIDGIAGRSAWSQALSRGLDTIIGMSPLGLPVRIGDIAQKGMTSGFGAIRGNEIGGILGGITKSPITGILGGVGYDAATRGVNAALKDNLPVMAAYGGGMLGGQLGAQLGGMLGKQVAQRDFKTSDLGTRDDPVRDRNDKSGDPASVVQAFVQQQQQPQPQIMPTYTDNRLNWRPIQLG